MQKKIKVGFYFDCKNLNGLDLRECLTINPGLGGSSYDLLTTAEMLSHIDSFTIIFFTLENQVLPETIKQIVVKDELDAIQMAKRECIDIYVFNAKKIVNEVYELLEKLKVPSIAWVHNYLDYRAIKLIRECTAVKRVVFVGQQHYDAYVDDPIIKKSTYIYLIVPKNSRIQRELGDERIVTYVGSLVKTKGFYILARNWKYIVSKVPNAKLYVIGSGKLYDRTRKLGKYGIAEQSYEEQFMRYLVDSTGEILESVHFMGMLGKEKEDVYKKTYVGVVNPSGISETFCLSGVEFEACGIPVVTYKGYGLLDTVVNKVSGLTAKRGRKQAQKIVHLLKEIEYNEELGNSARIYHAKNFAPDIIVRDWVNLINDIIDDNEVKFLFSKKNMMYDWKWLKYLNYILQKKIPFLPKISICYAVSYIKVIFKKLLGKE